MDVEALGKKANEIREYFCGSDFDICTIVNGKSGKCEEDCKYCAQSKFYKTDIQIFDLISKEEALKDALKNYSKGVKRYSVVTSGKRATEKELDRLCEIYAEINKNCAIKLCASHGLLDYKQFLRLKAVGVIKYHNNLETSERFFPQICRTHTYQEKIKTIQNAQKAGMEVCSGGIIGLGEDNEDRVDMAFQLRELGIRSIPLNLLNPIKGTPLEKNQKVTEEDFIKIGAIFRFINPKAVIRLAGGRALLSDYGKRTFSSGVNGTISGELLTTYGNDTEKDIKMITELGFNTERN